MIIAILNQHDNADRCMIARSLAVLRARSGRKVCLVAAGSAQGTGNWCSERSTAGVLPTIASRSAGRHAEKVESLRRHFNDIVVDAGTHNTDDCYGVLVAAKLALVPVRGDAIDLGRQYALIERIRAARMYNHGLRTLFVTVGGNGEPSADERAAALAHVARLDGSTLATTTLRNLTGFHYGPGRCICDAETCDPDSARQMRELCEEVFASATAAQGSSHDPRIALPMLPGRAFTAL
jgi:chromosome partitioning protein